MATVIKDKLVYNYNNANPFFYYKNLDDIATLPEIVTAMKDVDSFVRYALSNQFYVVDVSGTQRSVEVPNVIIYYNDATKLLSKTAILKVVDDFESGEIVVTDVTPTP